MGSASENRLIGDRMKKEAHRSSSSYCRQCSLSLFVCVCHFSSFFFQFLLVGALRCVFLGVLKLLLYWVSPIHMYIAQNYSVWNHIYVGVQLCWLHIEYEFITICFVGRLLIEVAQNQLIDSRVRAKKGWEWLPIEGDDYYLFMNEFSREQECIIYTCVCNVRNET